MIHNICQAHSVSNATAWSLARFPYGLILRMAHAGQSLKHWDMKTLVNKHTGSNPGAQLLSQAFGTHGPSAQPNLYDVLKDLDGECGQAKIPAPHSREGESLFSSGRNIELIWKRFARLICGQEGPFSRGVRKKADQVAALCLGLWPNGPPQDGEDWPIPSEYSRDDFASTRPFLALLIPSNYLRFYISLSVKL